MCIITRFCVMLHNCWLWTLGSDQTQLVSGTVLLSSRLMSWPQDSQGQFKLVWVSLLDCRSQSWSRPKPTLYAVPKSFIILKCIRRMLHYAILFVLQPSTYCAFTVFDHLWSTYNVSSGMLNRTLCACLTTHDASLFSLLQFLYCLPVPGLALVLVLKQWCM